MYVGFHILPYMAAVCSKLHHLENNSDNCYNEARRNEVMERKKEEEGEYTKETISR